MSPDRGVKTAQTEAPRSSDSDARQHVEEEEETQWTDEESEDDDPGPQFQGLPTPIRERNPEIGIGRSRVTWSELLTPPVTPMTPRTRMWKMCYLVQYVRSTRPKMLVPYQKLPGTLKTLPGNF